MNGAVEDDTLRRARWWIAGRVTIATLLFGGTLLLTVGTASGFETFTARAMMGLIIVTYATSAAFGASVVLGQRLRWLPGAIIATDLAAICTLIWLSGGALSGFTVLLSLNVVVAALTTGPRSAWLAAGASLLVFMTLSVGLAGGWVPVPPDQAAASPSLDNPQVGVGLLTNTAALLLIPGLAGLLASRLSRTGGLLLRATQNVAELERLNDDIVRCIASGLIVVDNEGCVRTINPAALEQLGASPEEATRTPVSRYFPELEEGDPRARRKETTGVRSDGERFPAGYTATPIHAPDGTPKGTLISFQDLTEIRRLRELAAREERLAQLGRLSAGLAHEIRNPLSSISGSVELVRESATLEEEDARLLRIVSEEVERLNELVTTMMGFAKSRRFDPAPTDLGLLVSDVVAMARRSPVARDGLEIVSTGLPRLIACVDADQLRQVVWNLLKNALAASPPNGRVEVCVLETGSTDVRIEVRDEGPGVGDEADPQLFDAFFTTRTQGLGIGLALVRDIVQRHQGEVRGLNRTEGGAVFRVDLPRGLPEATSAPH